VEAAEKQAVWVHGTPLAPSGVSPSLEMFLACSPSGSSRFRLNYLGRVGCDAKSVRGGVTQEEL